MTTSPYIGAMLMGALHGVEPGHGWLVAALLALNRPHPIQYGFLAATIISFAHLVSSFALVPVYFGIRWFVDLSAPIFRYVAAGALAYLAYRLYTESPHGHGHGHGKPERGLWGLTLYAFALGFAHEEEFALLAFLVGGANPWWLITGYALAVSVSVLTLTCIAIKAYTLAHEWIHRYESYIPKVSAAILLVFALLFALNA